MLIFLIFSVKSHSQTQKDLNIVGQWKFTSVIYREEVRPPFNPHLNLYFEFFTTGTNRLWWNRSNEEGFCERFGLYNVIESQLHDHVVWVNPNNSAECAKDTDMQLGRKSITPIENKNGKLYMEFYIGEEILKYIFEKINN